MRDAASQEERIKRFVATFRNTAGPDEPLLLAESNERLGYQSVYERLVRIGEAAGLKVKLTPHVLRHSYAMALYAAEKDLLFVSRQLGHSSPQTTAIYARTYNGDAERQLRAIEADDA